MQQNSFFPGCNFSNRDITDARTGWSLCPVQDTDSFLTNRYGVNLNVDGTFSLLYGDLYLSQAKEALKHTMLVHESVFGSQIYELHRLYRRQKELMMEMEGTRHQNALYLNSGFPMPRTHWMSSSISAYQTRNLPHEEHIPYQMEAELVVDNKVVKSEKKVLDLELPVFEYNDMHGQIHEAPNFLKEQSLRMMSLGSGKQLSKLLLDLNEPAKIEEHSDNVFSQFLSPVTSNGFREESDTKNEGESLLKGFNGMNEAQESLKCREEYGIDLNMSPLSSEDEVTTIVKKLETEKPQESSSVSVHEKHSSNQPRVNVQALPCSTSTVLLDKRFKSFMRGSRSKKKVKLCPSNKTFKGSNHDPHLSAQGSSESVSNQTSMEKGSSSSLSEAKSAEKGTNLGKKRSCKPQVKSIKGLKVVARKSGRIKRKKSRKISLVREGNYQEVSAAEAMVDMSRKIGQETTDYITSLSRNLLWFAEISSVAEDYEVGFLEAMTLQQREKKLEEHETDLRLNSSDKKAAVSTIVLGKRRRSRARQVKRKCKDDQHDDNLSTGTFSECEANEDLQVLGKLIEASALKWNCGIHKNKSKSSPKAIDAFTSLGEEKTGIYWGALKKRRRSSRIPAADFKHMIINQVV